LPHCHIAKIVTIAKIVKIVKIVTIVILINGNGDNGDNLGNDDNAIWVQSDFVFFKEYLIYLLRVGFTGKCITHVKLNLSMVNSISINVKIELMLYIKRNRLLQIYLSPPSPPTPPLRQLVVLTVKGDGMN
jgi:hypothetical protein